MASNKHRDTDEHLQHLHKIADLMDSRFTVPGTKIRFGLDPVLGLLPGIGDTASLAVSAYIFGQASSYKLPSTLKIRMLFNIFMDWLVGLVPLAGDLFDVGWRANRRNLDLLRVHLGKAPAFASETYPSHDRVIRA